MKIALHEATMRSPPPSEMADFKRLNVWKTAHALTLQIYRETAAFPPHERFGLTNQLRRAAVSVGANIAEGTGRGGDKEFARFLTIALGSVNEVEYLLLVAIDLGYIQGTKLIQEAVIVGRMLQRLRQKTLLSARNS